MLRKLLIANRGEIAIRIARSAADLGITTVAVYSEDDAASRHVQVADRAVGLRGSGAAAYVDARQLIAVALDNGCDAVHTGYGFLSESAEFARLCEQAALIFVGPTAATLECFGDKVRTRQAAIDCGISVLAGTAGPVTEDEDAKFMRSLSADAQVMLKALTGGGGRGMRRVGHIDDIAAAFALHVGGHAVIRCRKIISLPVSK